MRRVVGALLGVGLVVVGAACGDDQGAGGDTTELTVSPELAPFCDAMDELAAGEETEPAAILDIYERIDANAPPELEDDAEVFLSHAREITETFADLDEAEVTEAETREAFESMSEGAQDTLDALSVMAESGAPEEGPAGAVLTYWADRCPQAG